MYKYIYYVTFKFTCGLLTQGLVIPRFSSSHLPRRPPGPVLCNVRCPWKPFLSDWDVGMKLRPIEWKCTNVSLLLRLHSKQMAMFPKFHNSICHSCAVNVSLWAPPPPFFLAGGRKLLCINNGFGCHTRTLWSAWLVQWHLEFSREKNKNEREHLRPCQCLAKVKIITH
jgi:hypothetical protein